MSHFIVVVRLPAEVQEDDLQNKLADILQPYHEFECTGVADQYVKSIDQTEEARKEYEEAKEHKLKSPEGELFDKYDDRFFRDPTPEELDKHKPMIGTGVSAGIHFISKDWGDGECYRAKVHQIPEGYEEIEQHTGRSFAEFIEGYYGRKPVLPGEEPQLEGEHKYGWYRFNEQGEVTEVIDRTNPDRKWDWYTIGGRWSGYFPIKSMRQLMGKTKVEIELEAELGEATRQYNQPEEGTEEQAIKIQELLDRLKEERKYNTLTNVDLELKAAEEEFDEFQRNRRVGEPGDMDRFWELDTKLKGLQKLAYIGRRRQSGVRLGNPGVFGNVPEPGHSDIVRKLEIDFALVAQRSEEAMEKFWVEWQEFLKGKKFDAFDGPRSKALSIGLLEVREGAPTPGEEDRAIPWSPFLDGRAGWHDIYRVISKEEFMRAYRPAFFEISGYAYLDEAGWHEPGRMGWFGCSTDSPETLMKNKQEFIDWLKGTPDDAWLLAVDCHI